MNNLNISINLEKFLGIEGKEKTLRSEKEIKFSVFYCVALAQPITVHEFQFSHSRNGDDISLVGRVYGNSVRGMRNHGEFVGLWVEIK